MLSIIFVIVQNLLILPLFFLINNQIERKVSFRSLIIFYAINALLFIGIWSITGLSAKQLITEWSQWFSKDIRNWYIFAIIGMMLFFVSIIPFLYQQVKELTPEKRRYYGVISLGLFFITIVIWAFFGFSSYPHWEIWTVRNYFTIGENKLGREIISRLSVLIPHTLFHLLDPNSFLVYNVAHFLFTWFKGLLLFSVLKQFGFKDILVGSVVILTVFYPTPTHSMSLRNITILMSTVFTLLSVYIFLVYFQKPSRLSYISFIVAMFISVTFNEYAFLLQLVFPGLLLYFEKRVSVKLINASIIWYSLPFAYVGYYYLVSRITNVYGTQFIAHNSRGIIASLYDTVNNIVREVLLSFETIFYRSWNQVISLSNISLDSLLLTFVVSIIAFAIGIYIIKKNRSEQSIIKQPAWLATVITGVLIIALASVVFGVFIRPQSQWRIYGFSSIGAMLIIGLSLYHVCERSLHRLNYSIIYLCLISILFSFSFHQSFQKYQDYWNISQTNQKFLQQFDQYDIKSFNTVWVFMTDMTLPKYTEKVGDMIYKDVRELAIRSYLTESLSPNTKLCYSELSNCIFSDNSLLIQRYSMLEDEPQSVHYDELVLFWIDSDFNVTLLDELPDDVQDLSGANLYQPWEYIERVSS